MKRHLIYHSHVDTHSGRSIPVAVNLDDKTIQTTLERISRNSLTLSCDELALSQLLPNYCKVGSKDPLVFQTEFKLHSTITLSSRVAYTRRTAKNNFLLEMNFMDVSEPAMRQIDAFIEAKLKAKNQPKLNSCVDLKRKEEYGTQKTDFKSYLNVA